MIPHRAPSPRDLIMHPQSMMQNALIKTKLEEQRENYRKRQEHQQQQQQQRITSPINSPSKQIMSPTPLAFTPTSVLRKMTAEKEPDGADIIVKKIKSKASNSSACKKQKNNNNSNCNARKNNKISDSDFKNIGDKDNHDEKNNNVEIIESENDLAKGKKKNNHLLIGKDKISSVKNIYSSDSLTDLQNREKNNNYDTKNDSAIIIESKNSLDGEKSNDNIMNISLIEKYIVSSVQVVDSSDSLIDSQNREKNSNYDTKNDSVIIIESENDSDEENSNDNIMNLSLIERYIISSVQVVDSTEILTDSKHKNNLNEKNNNSIIIDSEYNLVEKKNKDNNINNLLVKKN